MTSREDDCVLCFHTRRQHQRPVPKFCMERTMPDGDICECPGFQLNTPYYHGDTPRGFAADSQPIYKEDD